MPDELPQPISQDQLHSDLREATAAIRELAAVFAPIIPHIPAILEMANAWGTGKAVTKTAQALESVLDRLSKLVLALAIIYAAWKLGIKDLLGLSHLSH
jgi:hypothetical protein